MNQVPHLEAGDIIIDGGNSEYTDTNRRVKTLREKGIYFMGSGALRFTFCRPLLTKCVKVFLVAKRVRDMAHPSCLEALLKPGMCQAVCLHTIADTCW